jgi:Flp pilus assembly protein TadD
LCWLSLLAAPVAADETFVLIPPPKPAKTLENLAPASGAPAIPDPDPLTITPLIPVAETEMPSAAPTPPSPEALEEIAKDLPAPVTDMPAALTPVPAHVPRASIATTNDTPLISTPSEPLPMISKESRDILAKIPSGIDTRKPVPNMKLDIERAKDTKYISAESTPAADEQTATSNAMGMSIQMKKSPLNFDYELEKAYNAIVAGHTEVAIEIYERILANSPNHKDALFGLASSYHRAGQLDRARPLYGKLLSLDPNNRDALNNFLVLLADEAPEEALDQMAMLEDKNPGFSTIPAQMAVIYQKMGQLDKASDKMFKAAALAPENLTYRYNLAILLDKQQKYDEAGKLYKQLLEASTRGEVIPGNMRKIQERLTFISSNRP